jgi:hypothetical protein
MLRLKMVVNAVKFSLARLYSQVRWLFTNRELGDDGRCCERELER